MNDTTAKDKLRPFKWKLYNTADAGLLPDGQIMRYIEGVQHKDVHDLVRFLERFVDVSNYENNSAIRYAFVANPVLENQTKAGNWRHVRTEIQRVDSQGRVGPDGTTLRIVQTLAEGWLTSLSAGEARPKQGIYKPGDTAENTTGEDSLVVEWVGVDPDAMHDLARTLTMTGNDGTVAQKYRKLARNDGNTEEDSKDYPNVGTESLSLLYAVAQLAEDGSGLVQATLGRPEYRLDVIKSQGGISETDRVYIWDVPEAEAKSLADSFNGTGTDISASYGSRDGLVNLVIDVFDRATSNKTTTSYDEGVHEQGVSVLNPHAASPLADPVSVSAGTYKDVRNLPTPEGSYRTTETTVSRSPTDTGWQDAGNGRTGGRKIRIATNQSQGNALVIAASSPSSLYFTRPSISGPDNKFGLYNVTVVATPRPSGYSAPDTYGSYTVEVDGKFRQQRTKDGKTQYRIWNMKWRYAGDTSVTAVRDYLENSGGNDFEGVRIAANSRGEYFEGQAYKYVSVDEDWTDDDTEA